MTTQHIEGSGAPVLIEGVRKSFGKTTVLTDVNLDINAGEFLTLLGASGSGKSTLLNIVAGFLKADRGGVAVDGVDLTKLPPHKRGLGMVFQHYALFPHMNVFENVAFPLKRQGVPKDQIGARVTEALDVVELSDLGDRKPLELSGGQQQRVALARAIVFRPRVLLMDEPLSALDKKLREQLQLEIRRLHQDLGITVIFVTHDQGEALTMSDRIALLRRGDIVQVGTPAELYDRPNSRYSAEFIGVSNILNGHVENGRFHDTVNKVQYRLPDDTTDDSTCVMIRPERLMVAPCEQNVPDDLDRISAHVEDSVYMGSDRTVLVRTEAGERLEVRTDVPRDADSITPGVKVNVFWRTEDLRPLT